MKIFCIILIVFAALIVLCTVICFSVAMLVLSKAFGSRFDKNPLLKYYSAEDFGLDAQAVETKAGSTLVRGYIYTKRPLDECKTLVVFAHGIGPGQCSYTTEIAYFCNNGCAVLAFDAAGCNYSDGKALNGLENATKCLEAAVRFAAEDSRLKGKKVILAGHSMGAYAALCVTRFVKADGVVAFSAPDSPPDIVCYLAESVTKKSIKWLKPWLKLASRVKTGKYANISASAAIEKSGVKALLIHGDSDPQVPVNLSAYGRAQGENITKMLCKGKKHNPYNTINAENELAKLSQGLADCGKMSENERETFFSSRDYDAICEEDGEVMSAVLKFIESI